MSFISLLSVENIFLDIQAQSSSEAIRGVFNRLQEKKQLPLGCSAAYLSDCLDKREEQGSTGIGHGVAVPHARVKELSAPFAAFARIEGEGVDFEAIDTTPVTFIILLLIPEDGYTHHLATLAGIARIMQSAHTREALRGAKEREEVYSILEQAG